MDLTSYNWRNCLETNPTMKGVPVDFFEHVPFHNGWGRIAVKGFKIEVKLRRNELPDDFKGHRNAYWIGRIEDVCGYMAKIIYDGAELIPEANRDKLCTRWIHLVKEGKRVGFTPLDPSRTLMSPKCLKDKLTESQWREYIYSKLMNQRSFPLPITTTGELIPEYKSGYEVGDDVEVLDKECVSRMRLGQIAKVVGGRVHVRYWNSALGPQEADVVCHEKSPELFPPGWSQTIGIDISASEDYSCPVLKDSALKALIDCEMPDVQVVEGMRFEVVDPLRPRNIAAATVQKVLKLGYMMIVVDAVNPTGVRLSHGPFCYHITSPLIFPCGFCRSRGIDFVPPTDYVGDARSFRWSEYLKKVNGEPLPIFGLRKDDTSDKIEVGMELEAADVVEPHLICVATVSKVHGRLIKISFNGWGEEYDQWMDKKSTDIFPVGWCEMNSYTLQPPPVWSHLG